MKSLICACCILLSAVILGYTGNNEGTNRVNKNPEAAIENLNFKVTGAGEKFRVITADFDVISDNESNGEIKILIDGKQLVNNRLIVKKGDSHYSLDFILHYPGIEENQRLYSASANLIINGTTNDIKQKAFVLNSSALAGNGSNSGR